MDDLICAVDADSGAAYLRASHVGDLIASYESQIAQLESLVSDIDPIQYGALTAQVATLEEQVAELRSDVRSLLELANKSRGGLWAGMVIASSVGGIVGFFTDHFFTK